MTNCPHCGHDTRAERPAPPGTVAAGSQLYRTRREGARILPGESTADNVQVGSRPSDAA